MFVLAIGASSFATTSKTTTTHVTKMVKIPGGTMTLALAPSAAPNYIFPMMGPTYFSVSNFQLIYMMYRPLYWFGLGTTPLLNENLSLAHMPVYSNGGRRITVKLKNYKWSNGETVTPQDVLFWSNMVKANATSWAGFAPGPGQYPGDVTNVVADNATDTVTFTTDGRYSSYWFTYNELSQISPLPIALDITSARGKPGSGGCSSASYKSVVTTIGAKGLIDVSRAAKACAAVYPFLTSKTEAGDLGTYATNPLWQVVNGPFHLTAYDATENGATVVPNPAYSGPIKPSIDKLVLAPFTTDSSEFNVLAAGKTLNIGDCRCRTCPSTRVRPSTRQDSRCRAEQRSAGGQVQLRPCLRMGRQLLRPQLHEPGHGPDLAGLRSSGNAVADEPDPLDPALQRRLRGPQLRTGAGVPTDRPGDEAGELQPVPHNRAHAKALSYRGRLEGRPERPHHLREAGHGSQRVRSRHQGR